MEYRRSYDNAGFILSNQTIAKNLENKFVADLLNRSN